MLEGIPGLQSKAMKSCIGYFDPRLSFGSFSLKVQALAHLLCALFSLPFCVPAVAFIFKCSVVFSETYINQSLSKWSQCGDWRSLLSLNFFEVDLEIKK